MNENGGMVMPVGPMYGNGGAGMWGDGGFFWLLVLFIFAGFGTGNGFGWGGNNTVNDVQRGFDQQAVMGSLNGLTSAVTTGFAGVNQGIANGFAQAEIAANSRQMADMNQNFAIQTGISNLGYNIATEACSDRQAISNLGNQITALIENKFSALQAQSFQDKIDAKNERIAELQNQVTMANLAASQNAQTATIVANNEAQTAALENYLNPPARPAYIVQNPNCCTNRFMA